MEGRQFGLGSWVAVLSLLADGEQSLAAGVMSLLLLAWWVRVRSLRDRVRVADLAIAAVDSYLSAAGVQRSLGAGNRLRLDVRVCAGLLAPLYVGPSHRLQLGPRVANF